MCGGRGIFDIDQRHSFHSQTVSEYIRVIQLYNCSNKDQVNGAGPVRFPLLLSSFSH